MSVFLASCFRHMQDTVVHWRKPSALLSCCCVLLASLAVTACSLDGGSAARPAAAPTVTTTLAHLHWCSGKPLMVFRDLGASATATVPAGTTVLTPASGAPTTITDWSVVKARLGFTVYLPDSLPAGTCLMSASGTIHDPIFGSSFTIGFLLPDHDSMSFSEAPLRTQNPAFQCSVSTNTSGGATGGMPGATPAAKIPMQLCTGAHKTTNIVFSARGKTSDLQTLFQNLQPDVDWIPAA